MTAQPQQDCHVKSWAVGQLRETTGNSTWQVTSDGNFSVGGPHGRLARYKEIILANSDVATDEQVQVDITGGKQAVEDGSVPLSLIGARLTIPGELGENSFFHREMRGLSSKFDDACTAAANENLVDMLFQAMSIDTSDER